MNGAAKKTASEWTQFVPQENPDSLEKSRELNFPSLAINLMHMNFWVDEGVGMVPSKVSRERIIDIAELLTSSFDELEQILVEFDPRHNAIVWMVEKLPVSSMWKWNISENSSGLSTSSWTPKMTDERRLVLRRSEMFCIHDSNIFASSESLEDNWWILTSAKPAIFFSVNMDLGRKDRDQAISWSETWSMMFTACKLWVSLNSEVSVVDLSFWASMAENFVQMRFAVRFMCAVSGRKGDLNSDDAALRAQEMKWICVRRILRDICTVTQSTLSLGLKSLSTIEVRSSFGVPAPRPNSVITCHCDARSPTGVWGYTAWAVLRNEVCVDDP